jgi:hypothetical protein
MGKITVWGDIGVSDWGAHLTQKAKRVVRKTVALSICCV